MNRTLLRKYRTRKLMKIYGMVSGEFASHAPESRLDTQSRDESHVVASACFPSAANIKERC